MEEQPPRTGEYPALDEDSVSVNFSNRYAKNFFRLITKKEDPAFFDGPLDDDELHGIIELYARTRSESGHAIDPQVFDRQIGALSLRLQGWKWAEIAQELDADPTDLTNDYHNVRMKIRQELQKFLEEPSTTEFDAKKVEALRIQVNEYAGKELLVDSLDDAKVHEMLEMQSRMSEDTGGKLAGITAYLQGKTMVKIYAEMHISPPRLSEAKAQAAKNMARELYRLLEIEPLHQEINSDISMLIEKRILFDSEAAFLRQYIGTNGELSEVNPRQVNAMTPGRIQWLLARKEKRVDPDFEGELPSRSQKYIMHQLLGDYGNGIMPVSRKMLVNRTEALLNSDYKDGHITEKMVEAQRNKYEHFILSSASTCLKSLALPEYTL